MSYISYCLSEETASKPSPISTQVWNKLKAPQNKQINKIKVLLQKTGNGMERLKDDRVLQTLARLWITKVQLPNQPAGMPHIWQK